MTAVMLKRSKSVGDVSENPEVSSMIYFNKLARTALEAAVRVRRIARVQGPCSEVDPQLLRDSKKRSILLIKASRDATEECKKI